jgi:hypothetical protein
LLVIELQAVTTRIARELGELGVIAQAGGRAS